MGDAKRMERVRAIDAKVRVQWGAGKEMAGEGKGGSELALFGFIFNDFGSGRWMVHRIFHRMSWVIL